MLTSRKFARTLRHGCRTERGYILLSMMLFVTLLVIAAAAIAPTVAFQAKRDREEEMVHRGVQYSRAVRRYFKKFGRYPTRLEELENTNNLRFLRKRYKDPITGQDFKVLHLGEVQLNFGAGIAGATPAGALNQAAGQGFAAIANAQRQFQAANKPPDQNAGEGEGDDAAKKDSDSGSSDKLAGITFGGGPIVGVVSTSKDATIREFNKKKHYNQWQFIYDPSSDRGGLLNTPNQPPLQGTGAVTGVGPAGAPGGIPGQPGQQPQTPPQQPNQNPEQQ